MPPATVSVTVDTVVSWPTTMAPPSTVWSVTTVSTVTLTVAGGTIPISDPFYAALTGKQSAGSNFVRTFTDVLVLYVPPAGSAALVQLLAAEHAVTSATAE